MKAKKLMSAFLTVAMLASMSVSAFAADAKPDAGVAAEQTGEAAQAIEVTSEGSTTAPTIKVKLPTTAPIVLNPYGIEVGDDKVTDQVISADVTIENLSDTDVAVFVNNCQGAVAGTMKLATAAPKATDVTNSAFFVLRMRASEDGTDLKDLTTEAFKAGNATTVGDVPVTAAAMKTPILVAKLVKSADGTAVATGGKAYGRFYGAMTKAPTVPWTDTDTVSITTTYSVKATTIA